MRQRILNAARELFVREGYEKVTMRRVAEKIEYSPTTIYLYFRDKEDLLFRLCEETFARLVRQFEALERQETDPVANLRKGLRAYVEFGLKHPSDYKMTFMSHPGHHADPEKYLDPNTMGMKAFSYLPKLVGAAVRQGKFRPLDVVTTSQALWAGVHGITSLLISHPHFPWADRDKVIDHLVDTLLTGCCCERQGEQCGCKPSSTGSSATARR